MSATRLEVSAPSQRGGFRGGVEEDQDFTRGDQAQHAVALLVERVLTNPIVGAFACDELLDQAAQRLRAECTRWDLDRGIHFRFGFAHRAQCGTPEITEQTPTTVVFQAAFMSNLGG